MSYSPSREIYPDSEEAIIAAHRDAHSEVPKEIMVAEPSTPKLTGVSTAELFDEIVDRAVSLRNDNIADSLFGYFARQSELRSRRWVSTGTRDLSVLERAAEMAGEAGEVTNVAKKLLRAELGMMGNYKPGDTTVEELVGKLEYEMGDVLVTLFNLQNKVPGVDLLRGFRRAFNEKSEQLGFPERV